MRPASHTNALGSLFIPTNREKRKRESIFSHESLPGWFGFRIPKRSMLNSKSAVDQHLNEFPEHGERFRK